MSIYAWITLVLMLSVVVITNTDEHPKIQMVLAIFVYITLVGLTVAWVAGV